jgi:hypothetical protein
MGHLAAHAHADTLAVYLHVGGRPVLVDAGTYLYHSVGDWRDRLRRTAEHNTVVVAAEDSSLMVGPFNWKRGRRAAGRLVSVWSTDTGWSVEAEHHGYVRRHGVVHRRTVEGLGARSVRLTDHLAGRGSGVAFRWSFLFAPGLDAVPSPEGWLLRSGDTDLVELRLPPEWRSSARKEPAWHSPAFGRLEPACRLLVEGRVAAHTSIQVDINAQTSPEHVRSGLEGAT